MYTWYEGDSPLFIYGCIGFDMTIDECFDTILTGLYERDLDDEGFTNLLLNQVEPCWMKFSNAYGWTHVRDWENDPFCERWWAFQMPNSRLYEHFYNDPECNQVWRMGRGREQPDAITFYDVPKHDHNKILLLNRLQITPWVTHDELVLQFFGVTKQCVELEPDVLDMGRGLVKGQFRIEYLNGTSDSLAAINGGDFGHLLADRPDSSPVGDTAVPMLLETHVFICRTPHYLAVCKDKFEAHYPYLAPCSAGCEYFADYNLDDDSAERYLDRNGTYHVDCRPGSVLSFNGTASDPDAGIKTLALQFDDRCENDAYVFTSGQLIVLEGDSYTGTLEVLVDVTRNTTAEWPVLEFRNHIDPTGLTSNNIVMLSELEAAAAPHDIFRVWVYYKHGVFDVCYKGCRENDYVDVCMFGNPTADHGGEMFQIDLIDSTTDMADIIYLGAGDHAGLDGAAGNDYINSGLGNDTLMGGAGDDILEDHGGKDKHIGGAGNDIVISRSGYDHLDATTGDDADLDTNKYIIYPTQDKAVAFGHDTTEEDTCSQLAGMMHYDSVIFKMDDPTYKDYKYTNDDDTCAVEVGGWEIEWFFDMMAIPILDVWFSRKTEMAWICLNTGGAHVCTGDYNTFANFNILGDACMNVWVKCDEVWLDEGETLDDWIADDSWLDWYGWW